MNSDSETREARFNGFFLPNGEMLRTFVNQSEIRPSLLKTILRKRGVFAPSTHKSSTVPILTSSLLSVSEFGELLEGFEVKEHTRKHVTRKIPWDTEASLLDTIETAIFEDMNDEFEFSNYSITRPPDVLPLNDEIDTVQIPITIERSDSSRNFCESSDVFESVIEVQKMPDGDSATISISYTASETKDVCDRAVKKLLTHLREVKVISGDTEVQEIRFANFNNAERISFLLALTLLNRCQSLTFKQITDIAMARDADENTVLPQKLHWIEDKIEKIRCHGASLEQTSWLREPDCRPHLIVHDIEAKFAFNFNGCTGKCVVAFGFPKYSKKNLQAEFRSNITQLTIESAPLTPQKGVIEAQITRELQEATVAAGIRSNQLIIA